MLQTDVLVVGSGIAGLSFAKKIATARPDLHIAVVTKATVMESNTRFAQGGISVVSDFLTDSFEKHIADTLTAGRGLSDYRVVEMVVNSAPLRLKELLEWGVDFDVNPSGVLDLNNEGGHSCARVVHVKDQTGLEIEKVLLKKITMLHNVTIYSNLYAIDLICKQSVDSNNPQCVGIKTMNQTDGTIKPFFSGITMLATGGCGQIYLTTTNPEIATGDGVAMASRAGAAIKDMRFIQFHPTGLHTDKFSPSFLISEAVRGFGAFLVDSDGKRFLFNYDERGELATRDIVSLAIETELKLTKTECVHLDCRHLDFVKFRKHFPTITAHCKEVGIDIRKDLIPVVPAAHYQCGGIQVDLNSRTTINSLYASGECASTGLHGANRLASNSLLEALVFSHQAYLDVKNYVKTSFDDDSLSVNSNQFNHVNVSNIEEMKLKLRKCMSLYVGISRTKESLEMAAELILEWSSLALDFEISYKPSKSQIQWRNMLCVASLIVKDAYSHFDTDDQIFPSPENVVIQPLIFHSQPYFWTDINDLKAY